MNDPEVKKFLAVLAAAYDNVAITDATIQVWKMALNNPSPIPYDAAMFALTRWIPVNKWAPKPVELRDIVAEQVCGLPSADEAWNHLQRWLKAGYPGIPDSRPPLPDLTAQTCRDIGGTSMVRNAERPDQMRARFAERYERLRREQMQVADVGQSWRALSAPERKAIA